MHIPDGVLSPATCAVAGAAMLPVWAVTGRCVRHSLGARQIPLLALGAAFCFTIMMFNIPALGGTTAHPVAGTLLAVMLGPCAACIGISVALAIQALFFGDGGILAYGANCFTMAFVLPFVGYTVYQLLASRTDLKSPRRALFAGIGAYIGLNAAAAVVAVLLGIQPVLFHEPNGHALYFPFGFRITLPAMLGTHLLIAGPAEAIVTVLVVCYIQTAGIPLYGDLGATMAVPDAPEPGRRRRWNGLWIGLMALVALSPLGLLAKGDAWGEWDKETLARQIERVEGKAYIPRGVAAQEEHSYKGIHGLQDYASGRGARGYLVAGILGAGVIVLLLLSGGRLLARNREADAEPWDEEQSAVGGTDAAPLSGDLPAWMRASPEETPPDRDG
jgi:cobalt/nickel transport system permease protein